MGSNWALDWAKVGGAMIPPLFFGIPGSSGGWVDLTADLTAYAGQHIRLRLAFSSDSSGTYPGVYVDDVLVIGN